MEETNEDEEEGSVSPPQSDDDSDGVIERENEYEKYLTFS